MITNDMIRVSNAEWVKIHASLTSNELDLFMNIRFGKGPIAQAINDSLPQGVTDRILRKVSDALK